MTAQPMRSAGGGRRWEDEGSCEWRSRPGVPIPATRKCAARRMTHIYAVQAPIRQLRVPVVADLQADRCQVRQERGRGAQTMNSVNALARIAASWAFAASACWGFILAESITSVCPESPNGGDGAFRRCCSRRCRGCGSASSSVTIAIPLAPEGSRGDGSSVWPVSHGGRLRRSQTVLRRAPLPPALFLGFRDRS